MDKEVDVHEEEEEKKGGELMDNVEKAIVPIVDSKDMFPIGYYWLSLLKAKSVKLRECMNQEFDEQQKRAD